MQHVHRTDTHPDGNMRLPLPEQGLGICAIRLQHIVAVHDGFSWLFQLQAACCPVQQAGHSHGLQLFSHVSTAAGEVLGHPCLIWRCHLRQIGQCLCVFPDCSLVVTLYSHTENNAQHQNISQQGFDAVSMNIWHCINVCCWKL